MTNIQTHKDLSLTESLFCCQAFIRKKAISSALRKENPDKMQESHGPWHGATNNTKLVSKCFAYVFDVLVIGGSVKRDLLLTIILFAFKSLRKKKKMTRKRRAALVHREFLKSGNVETCNN